jgi:hypothetical protein
MAVEARAMIRDAVVDFMMNESKADTTSGRWVRLELLPLAGEDE